MREEFQPVERRPRGQHFSAFLVRGCKQKRIIAQQLEIALGGRRVERGEFGAMMQVVLVNDSPITLLIDTRERE